MSTLYQDTLDAIIRAWGKGDKDAAWRMANNAQRNLGLSANDLIARAVEETGVPKT